MSCLLYECMYDQIYSKSMDQPGKVANPVCGQLNKENEHFLCLLYVPMIMRFTKLL